MMNDNKSPEKTFLEGKGFYIALALCVAGTGTAAWLAVNRTIDDIDDQNQKILESRPQTEDFTDPGEVDAEQNGVTISSEGEDSSSDVSSSVRSSTPIPAASWSRMPLWANGAPMTAWISKPPRAPRSMPLRRALWPR